MLIYGDIMHRRKNNTAHTILELMTALCRDSAAKIIISVINKAIIGMKDTPNGAKGTVIRQITTIAR